MKFFTSYFYNVRFFKPHQIPFSTALFDPKWFNANKGQGTVFIDKNGVINGLRAEKLHPGKECEGLCHGKPCDKLPTSCDFLKQYEKQLMALDIESYKKKLETAASIMQKKLGFKEEPEIILLVHEAPNNDCSERCVLQKTFGCEEWTKASTI